MLAASNTNTTSRCCQVSAMCVTLAVVTEKGLLAISTSVPVIAVAASASAISATGPTWRPHPCPRLSLDTRVPGGGRGSSDQPPPAEAAAAAALPVRHASEWRATTQQCGVFVSVDVVAPCSVPAGWLPRVQMGAGALTVELLGAPASKSTSKKAGGKGSAGRQERSVVAAHTVALPPGVATHKGGKLRSGDVVKHSDEWGLVSIRLNMA